MITLVQDYNQDSQDLHYSLVSAGIETDFLSLNDNGFLPDYVHSPYAYFTRQHENKGNPLYFNQLPVPAYWEISGNGQGGEVTQYGEVRARIHYAAPKHLRLIQSVEWLDKKGVVRSTDRYNQYGWRFGQTIHDVTGKALSTTYYNRKGQEVLVEHHQTGDLSLNDGHQIRVFKNRIQFIHYYLQQAQFDLSSIMYNSLGEPFMVAYHLKHSGKDFLVWQEGMGDSIPGNMKFILEGKASRPTQVLVQKRDVYDKLKSLMTPEEALSCHFIGSLYHLKSQNTFGKTALILTNSDQLEQIESLVSSLPDFNFKIAALTEMSAKLTSLETRPNVQLFPNVSRKMIETLYQGADIYLDINHHGEILSAVRMAFEYQQIILTFKTTAHNPAFMNKELIFDANQVDLMIATLQKMGQDESFMQKLLQEQIQASDYQDKETYRKIWEGLKNG